VVGVTLATLTTPAAAVAVAVAVAVAGAVVVELLDFILLAPHPKVLT